MQLVKTFPQNVAQERKKCADEAVVILMIRKYRKQECGLLGLVPMELCREMAKQLFFSRETDLRLLRAEERDASDIMKQMAHINDQYNEMLSYLNECTKDFKTVTDCGNGSMGMMKYYSLHVQVIRPLSLADPNSDEALQKRIALKYYKECVSRQQDNLEWFVQSQKWGEENLAMMDKADRKKREQEKR